MTERATEVLVGGAVLAVAAGFLLYAGQVAGLAGGSGGKAEYFANFRSIEGVSVGTDVRLAGVKVGAVTDVALDPQTYTARTVISVDEGLLLPEDTLASIASEGLLGGNYVELVPGGMPDNYAPGDEIRDTQSAVSLITLLLKFVSGGGEEDTP
jgi:phospholipid/cholesterol/gamma-HCH transport system substrate-binding protein